MLTYTLTRHELDDKKRKHRYSDDLQVKLVFSLPPSSSSTSWSSSSQREEYQQFRDDDDNESTVDDVRRILTRTRTSSSCMDEGGVDQVDGGRGGCPTRTVGNVLDVLGNNNLSVNDESVGMTVSESKLLQQRQQQQHSQRLRERQEPQQRRHPQSSSSAPTGADRAIGGADLQPSLLSRGAIDDGLGMNSETSSFHSESDDEVDSDANVVDGQQHHRRLSGGTTQHSDNHGELCV